MARIDHFNDPSAPKANSIVPSTTAFVLNDASQLLLIRRSDNDLWSLPGGAQDPGEYIADAAVRETLEESGIDIIITGLIGIYTNPHHVMEYSDGEIRQQFSICFRARPIGGAVRTSDESLEVGWFKQAELERLTIHQSIRLRIDHGFKYDPLPYIG